MNPKELPETMQQQQAGTEPQLIATPGGSTMRSRKPQGKVDLADLRGILQYDGPPVPVEELCKPVELTEEESREYRP